MCDECAAGMQPQEDLTACEVCEAGHFSASGEACLACADRVVGGVPHGMHTPDLVECTVCADGTEPSADHSSCGPCPVGTAGQRGVCSPCVDTEVDGVFHGMHTPDRIQCLACPDGQQPNLAHTGCEDCEAGTAGANGVCDRCSAGQQPNADRTACIFCNDPNSFDQVNNG